MSESFDSILYSRSKSTMNTHAILSIIFGGLGILFGLPFMFLLLVGGALGVTLEDSVSAVSLAIFTLVLFIVPHIYLIVAGIHLLKEPAPRVARTLIIINLVIGALWNLVILIISIINLVQMSDYERGYLHRSGKTHAKK